MTFRRLEPMCGGSGLSDVQIENVAALVVMVVVERDPANGDLHGFQSRGGFSWSSAVITHRGGGSLNSTAAWRDRAPARCQADMRANSSESGAREPPRRL